MVLFGWVCGWFGCLFLDLLGFRFVLICFWFWGGGCCCLICFVCLMSWVVCSGGYLFCVGWDVSGGLGCDCGMGFGGLCFLGLICVVGR